VVHFNQTCLTIWGKSEHLDFRRRLTYISFSYAVSGRMKEMEVYTPRVLGRETTVPVSNIALQMASSNAVLIVGAGVSKAPPTSLPLGQEIARDLKHKLGHTALAECVKDLPEDDLLAIADAAEAQSPEALKFVQKTILDSFDFKTARPNYAHQFVALLMAEGTIQTMTTNWDTCIERAASMVYSDLVPCRLPQELGQTGTSAVLLKLHGCAEIEDSIRVSSRHVGEPVWWASHQIRAAIERNWVVFVGVGSIVPYVRETIRKILQIAGTTSRIRVVDIQQASDWDTLLQSPSGDFFIESSAEGFLDDILTSLTNRQLSEALTLAKQLAQRTPIRDIDIVAALGQVIEFFQKHPAYSIWLWVRRGLFPTICSPAVLDPTFVRYVLAMALVHSVSPLEELEIIGTTVSVGCKDFIVELVWAKEALASHVLCRRKMESLMADRRNHTLPPGKPCMIIVYGVAGPLPPAAMPESLVDTPMVDDIVDGPQTLQPHWVPLDSLLAIESKDELRDLIGME